MVYVNGGSERTLSCNNHRMHQGCPLLHATGYTDRVWTSEVYPKSDEIFSVQRTRTSRGSMRSQQRQVQGGQINQSRRRYRRFVQMN